MNSLKRHSPGKQRRGPSTRACALAQDDSILSFILNKTIALGILAALTAASVAAGQSDPTTQLTALLNNFMAAASHTPPSAADKATFNNFFADDVLYTRATGLVITKAVIMRSLDQPPSPGDPQATYSAEDVTIHAYGNTAIVSFTLVQRLPDNSTKRYRNTGTFLNRERRWQAVAWQATPIASPEKE